MENNKERESPGDSIHASESSRMEELIDNRSKQKQVINKPTNKIKARIWRNNLCGTHPMKKASGAGVTYVLSKKTEDDPVTKMMEAKKAK